MITTGTKMSAFCHDIVVFPVFKHTHTLAGIHSLTHTYVRAHARTHAQTHNETSKSAAAKSIDVPFLIMKQRL